MFTKIRESRAHRERFLAAAILGLLIVSVSNIGFIYAYTTDTIVYTPPNYLIFQPPAVGGSYTDAVFGTGIKRLSNAMNMKRADNGGTLATITTEYSTMSPFNKDNTRLLLAHFSYFGLYDGSGNYRMDLPLEINATTEPRWSRSDANVLYYVRENQLKKYNIGTNSVSVVHTFSEYSSISGHGESDICFDGNHFVLAGNGRYIFVYEISSNLKGPVLDTGGRSFDSLYITPNDNVTITWRTNGSSRFNGIELFDRNMNFLHQLTHAGGHMDVTRDTNGDEVLVWANGGDANLQVPCEAGLTKIRLSDAKQTCIWTGNWGMAIHVSTPDNSGWAFIETYVPSDPIPPAGWIKYTNEILQIKLDGTQVRRLAHHRSRPFNGYTYQPKVSVNRDGTKLVYASNYGLQSILTYPANYSDAYMIDVAAASPGTTGTSSGGTSTGSTGTTDSTSSGGSTTTTPATTTTVTRVEQNGSPVAYSGTWYPNGGSFNSAGSAVLAAAAGARATLMFNGTGTNWIAYRDQWAGIARVYVDGTLKAEVDTYASPAMAQATMYSVSGLTSGNHTLAIEVTGRKNASSGGAWVWVDAFDVTPGGTTTSSGTTTTSTTPTTSSAPTPTGTLYRIQQNNTAVRYSGYWYTNNNATHSGGNAKLAMTAGSRATLTFTGTSVSWIAYRDQWSGIARVYLDGALKGEIDTYSSGALAKAVMYSVSELTWGNHTIAIEAAGRKNYVSRGSWVWVDAFDFVGATLSSSLATESSTNSSAVTAVAGGAVFASTGGGSLQVGFAEVNPASGAQAPSGVAIFGFRQDNVLVSEAGVPVSRPVMKGRIYAEVAGNVNTGFAVANPNDSEAMISFFFTDSTGTNSGLGSVTIPPHGQIAQFLNEAPFSAARPTNGTFTFTSNIPVSVIALRGLTNERSEFLVTTVPVADPDVWLPATMFFPHFADGGGWTTQFVLVNPTDETITGTLNIDGQSPTSYTYNIPSRSSRKFSTPGTDLQIRVGSAEVTPDASSAAPVGVAIFSFRNRGVTVSEAGVPAINGGARFRMYAERENSGGIRTGIAVMNADETDQNVKFDLTSLDGSPTGLSGSIVVPGRAQRALFLNEIPGFESMPTTFRGIVRIFSEKQTDIAVVGFRGRANERGDFLVTTTPSVNEAAASASTLVFPHIVNGGGYTTQFILYSGTPTEPASGQLQMYSQAGGSLDIGLK